MVQKVRGLDEKIPEQFETEVFLGHYEDVFNTAENIKEFIQHGLLNPKKMELIISTTRILPDKDLNNGKKCYEI